MKKLRNNSGETLIESLASIVIVLLTFLFLTAAVVSAANINRRAKDADTDFSYDGQLAEDGFVNIWLNADQLEDQRQGWSLNVDKYETDNGYIYYSRHAE